MDWGDAGPLIQYEDTDTGHYFTLGQLSRRGTLTSTGRLSSRFRKLGLDALIYQNYLDRVAALIPGAKRRLFRSSSGNQWEQIAVNDSPKKGNPPLAALAAHGAEWFQIIDETVRKIREVLARREIA